MTTTEITGAEDVAWDLSDLYDGSDDPRLEAHIAESETAAAAFRERYYGKVASLSAGELSDAIAERERMEEVLTRVACSPQVNCGVSLNKAAAEAESIGASPGAAIAPP